MYILSEIYCWISEVCFWIDLMRCLRNKEPFAVNLLKDIVATNATIIDSIVSSPAWDFVLFFLT